jgi:hypothetical protein
MPGGCRGERPVGAVERVDYCELVSAGVRGLAGVVARGMSGGGEGDRKGVGCCGRSGAGEGCRPVVWKGKDLCQPWPGRDTGRPGRRHPARKVDRVPQQKGTAGAGMDEEGEGVSGQERGGVDGVSSGRGARAWGWREGDDGGKTVEGQGTGANATGTGKGGQGQERGGMRLGGMIRGRGRRSGAVRDGEATGEGMKGQVRERAFRSRAAVRRSGGRRD